MEILDHSEWRIMAQIGPEEVLALLKEHVQEEIAGEPGRWQEILLELERPEFATYLMGKLGCV